MIDRVIAPLRVLAAGSLGPLGLSLTMGLLGCGHPGPLPARAGTSQVAIARAVSVDSGQGGNKSVDVLLTTGGSGAQSIIHRWVSADVTQYDVVLTASGQQLAEAQVMTSSGQTEAIFTHLRLGVAYTIAATALGNVGGNPSAQAQILDAARPATASIEFAGTNDVNDETTINLAIQLDDVPFVGSATTSISASAGSYLAPSSPESGAATQDDSGVTTIAGSVAGYLDGAGSVARFDTPYGLAVDASNDIFVADSGNRLIREIDPSGVVTTFAPYSVSQGLVPGTAISPFGFFDGLALESSGAPVLADSRGGDVVQLASGASPEVFAGNGEVGLADGTDASASFDFPSGVALGPSGEIVVADTLNNCIRVIDPAGYVYTWLGSGNAGFSDGYGLATEFNHPTGLAFDASGDLFVADTDNDTIREVTPGGDVSTYGGSPGQFGDTDGPASQARFDGPTGIAAASDGALYVADTNNNTIREISPTGIVSTLAGSGYRGYSDGPDAAAEFDAPSGLALDGKGDLFVADTLNDKIRRIRVR